MDVAEYLSLASARLSTAGIATARLDTLVLLEDCLSIDRSLLLAHPERELTPEQLATLDSQMARRAAHEPLAYIRGKAEFYGRTFAVDKTVLVPRPETEAMVELLLKLPVGADTLIIDIGTGSGALAITAKLERPQASVIGIDIDPACLTIAARSAASLRADVEFLQGDLLAPVAGRQLKDWVLLCNLPYVPDNYPINPAAEHEPRLALFAGLDGLDLYRRLFEQIGQLAQQPGWVLTEALPEQHEALQAIAAAAGYELGQSADFIQCFASLTGTA